MLPLKFRQERAQGALNSLQMHREKPHKGPRTKDFHFLFEANEHAVTFFKLLPVFPHFSFSFSLSFSRGTKYIKSVCGQCLEENIAPKKGERERERERELYIKSVCGQSLEENVGPMEGRDVY
jgi:hypothetical protein